MLEQRRKNLYDCLRHLPHPGAWLFRVLCVLSTLGSQRDSELCSRCVEYCRGCSAVILDLWTKHWVTSVMCSYLLRSASNSSARSLMSFWAAPQPVSLSQVQSNTTAERRGNLGWWPSSSLRWLPFWDYPPLSCPRLKLGTWLLSSVLYSM